jgi:quercetin 2,3-dioxygenase
VALCRNATNEECHPLGSDVIRLAPFVFSMVQLARMQERAVHQVFTTKEALEGAGVKLHRGFGYFELPLFDPFLLFDDFSSSKSEDFLPGFPLHPHRGIETVTYVLKGDVNHKDSIGNAGIIGPGDVQWMNAGSGIVHEEMPHGADGLTGFQLWVNLPAKHKMMKPQYQEITADTIPTVALGGARVHVIAGSYNGTKGPVADIMASPTYLDIELNPGATVAIPVSVGDTSFLYIFAGSIVTSGASYEKGSILLHDRSGDVVTITTREAGARLLFISGTPLNEPIAWHGPIVMNTDEEIQVALYDLQNDTFIR